MELTEIRDRLDTIDAKLLDLFCERMKLAAEVAASKKKSGKAVFDPAREREKLSRVAEQVPEELVPQAVALFSLLMSMNKAEQSRILSAGDPHSIAEMTKSALKPADVPFPARASIACQGVEGAYSQIAASRLFRLPSIAL